MNLKESIKCMKQEQLKLYGKIEKSSIIASLRVYGFKREEIEMELNNEIHR